MESDIETMTEVLNKLGEAEEAPLILCSPLRLAAFGLGRGRRATGCQRLSGRVEAETSE